MVAIRCRKVTKMNEKKIGRVDVLAKDLLEDYQELKKNKRVDADEIMIRTIYDTCKSEESTTEVMTELVKLYGEAPKNESQS